MVADPGLEPVARPELGLTTAMLALFELQSEKVVRISVDRSSKCPVATNCRLDPTDMVAVLGESVKLVSWAVVTCRPFNVPATPPKSAVIFVLPLATPVTAPVVLPTVATPGDDDVQVATDVRLRVLPSWKLPVATS
jgi:hypothetical protein